MPIENYEEVQVYPLDPDVQEQLFELQNECTFIWGTKDHWAVGVIMNFVWREGRFWLTATSQRKRIAAVRRDNRVSLVITSTGTDLGPAKTVTLKGRCLLHDDQETKDWFYPALAAAVIPQSEQVQKAFAMTLDSPRRLIFEVVPEKYITFDGVKMMQDSLEAWTAEGSPMKEVLES
jgi:general stress protein 26